MAEEAPVTGLPAHSNGQRPTGGELLPTLNVQAPPSRDPGNEGAMSTQLKHQWSDTDVSNKRIRYAFLNMEYVISNFSLSLQNPLNSSQNLRELCRNFQIGQSGKTEC